MLKTYTLENKYKDLISDEEFAVVIELGYEVFRDFLDGFVVSLLLDDTDTISEVFSKKLMNKVIGKICGRDSSNNIVECKPIEQGKIQCEISDTISSIYPPEELLASFDEKSIKQIVTPFRAKKLLLNDLGIDICEPINNDE